MRRICTFIPAPTITDELPLGATANAHPATTAQRRGARSARLAATPKRVNVRAATGAGRIDSPLPPGGDDIAA